MSDPHDIIRISSNFHSILTGLYDTFFKLHHKHTEK